MPGRRNLLRHVLLPIALLIAVSMVALFGFIWFSARTQDRVTLETSVASVSDAIARERQRLDLTVKDYSWWDEAFEQLNRDDLDGDWAEHNIGEYIYATHGLELTLVIDRDDRTIFRRIDGEPADVDAFELLGPGLAMLVREARAAPVAEPFAASGVLRFGDGPALVAVGAVTPQDQVALPGGPRVALVFAKRLTQELLDGIAEPLPLTDLRILSVDAKLDSDATVPLVSPEGELLGQLVWEPHRPGLGFLRAVMPALAIALVVLVAFTSAVLRHARQTTTAIEASEARFRDVADASSDWIWETDAERRFTFLSDRMGPITGRKPDASLGLPVVDLFHAGETEERWQRFLDDLASWRPFRNVLSLCEDAEGIHRTVRLAGKPVFDGRGRPTGFRGTATDITTEMAAARRAQYLALHDPLTGFPNRLLLGERLEQAIAGVGRRGGMAALLLLDLDHFKDINDTLGHPAGDALLREVAARCAACVREVDTVARIGGDEFAIVQVGLEKPAEVQRLARRLLELFQQPIEIDGHDVLATLSIGVALIPSDASIAEKLLQLADIALYRAKEDGRNGVRFFEPDMDARLLRRRELERDLRVALARDELELYYQPKIALPGGALSGVEALVRWHHPHRGLITATEFIGIAEETGLILQLGEWVLRKACQQAVAWPELLVSVNISPVQFRRSDLAEVVRQALVDSGLPPHRLELETPESVLIQHTEAATALFGELKRLGVRIAMDDFGTGYSSLSYMHRFPFDKIKVDRSFIESLGIKPTATAIVRAMIGLASSLGMLSCAEGVETEDQLKALREEGCDEVQGFLFGRPMPAAELVRRFDLADDGPAHRAVGERVYT